MRYSTRDRRSVLHLALALATATATGIAAPVAAADRQAGQLEEIVVTATRHEESLSKVPLSVTALSQETLDVKGIKDFQDVARFTPGVTIDNSGTNAISIRGISSSGGAGTTGIYLDDTPIQMRALGFNPDDTLPKTFDLERVEVLRGPQGTLFGSGSEGGTVRYLMTQPSLTKESTYARSEVSFTRGGEPSYEAGIAHGGPLIDNVLGYRASVWYRYDGGWIDRVDPTTRETVDAHSNRANTMVARLAFVWQPVEGLQITPGVMYQNSRKHDQTTFMDAYSDISAGKFRNGSPERNPTPDEWYLPSLKIEADFAGMKLVSNTSYYNRTEHTAYLGSVYDLAYFQSLSWGEIGSCGSASTNAFDPNAPGCSWYPLIDAKGIHLPPGLVGYATPNFMTNKQASVTQEIRLQSNDDASRWKWTVGAFWSLSKETSIEELRDPNITSAFNILYGINPDDYFGPYYYCNGVGTPGQTFPDCDIYYNNNVVHDRQLAAFGELSYNVTDKLRLTAGGRLAKMTVSLSHYGDGYENFGPDRTSAEQRETAFTPKVGASYQLDPNNLFYATYAKGFRAPGVNSTLPPFCNDDLKQIGYPNGAPLTYNSDSTQSYEIGSKNSVGSRFRFATSVYYIKWHDIQQSVYVAGLCGLQFTDNLGTAVAKGFDVQAEMVLGGGFSLDAALGYTSARYSEDTAAPKPRLVSSGNAISGEAAINGGPGTNPPWTVALGAQYNFALAGHDAFLRLDWEYTSRNNWPTALQDPTTVQYTANTYTLSSTKFASLRGNVTFGNWSVAAFIDNLFDSRTITNYQLSQVDANSPTYDPLVPQSVQQNAFTFKPRTFGITATYRL